MQIRIYSPEKLGENNSLSITDHRAHYLINVMRLKCADELYLFNQSDGEYLSQITDLAKKNISIKLIKQIRKAQIVKNIGLAFVPVKNVKIDFIARKSVEMGAKFIKPILSEFSVVDKINIEKFQANIIEATQQSRRIDLAEISELKKFKDFLKNLQKNDIIFHADETGNGKSPEEFFKQFSYDSKYNYYLLIGPEGGFSDSERELLEAHSQVFSFTMGPRILRSDTAMIAGLTLLQNYLGDF
jgi:16S rRNA (uracil1498-N3)-methyltransferase